MNRVVVVGVTGVGKSTFAERLAERLDARFIELDALYWQPEWTPAPADRFESDVDVATSAERWVSAGGYQAVNHLTWGRADTMVWLHYSFPRVLWQLTKRTTRRVVRREELWNGNKERFAHAFLSKDSLFIWLLKTYWSRPARYEERLEADFTHLTVHKFRHPRQTEAWLEGVAI